MKNLNKSLLAPSTAIKVANQPDNELKKLIRQEQSIWHFMIQNAREAIVLLDMNGEVVEANQAYLDMLMYSREEIYELRVWDWDADLDQDTIINLLNNIDSAGVTFETRHTRKDGDIINVEISSNATSYQDERFLLCICRDTTERTQRDERMQELIIQDPLTLLLNRREFTYRLKNALHHAHQDPAPFALILFDIDHFKSINDTYGHLMGDRVLTDVATLLAQKIRGQDSFARWGGEEFAILLPNTHFEQACLTAERLRHETEHFLAGGIEHVTASFGVTVSKLSDDLSHIFNRADEAMYEAKGSGRNCVRWVI